MRSFRSLIAVGLIATCALSFADTKAELDAMYAKFNAAMLKKDLATVMSMCTKDFSWVDSKGKKISRVEMEAQMKLQFQFLKKVTAVTVTIEKVTMNGAEATAHTKGVFAGDLVLDPKTKKVSKLKSVSTTDDTWVKLGGKWMLKRVKALKETTTVDGKPING